MRKNHARNPHEVILAPIFYRAVCSLSVLAGFNAGLMTRKIREASTPVKVPEGASLGADIWPQRLAVAVGSNGSGSAAPLPPPSNFPHRQGPQSAISQVPFLAVWQQHLGGTRPRKNLGSGKFPVLR
ncbi:hypothetical protein KL928_004684 [Ogataea angusta]|uniref:Uncharacterized protein n=1 Tax=Pichia angusta TaxID=870730 RepID=A0AAN6I3Q5_PICAN|nr:uncharacterized protein KL928_004684 [Ogataea angusta]KAG7816642.1 hypothetical protein KL928_004684 [Ogataea angusta]